MTIRGVHSRDERGATLVIFAGSILAILAVLALVIDLGFGRATKRSSQSLTDIAALSAGYYLIGNDAPVGTTPIPKPQKACEEAINSLVLNLPTLDPSPADYAKCAAFASCPSADTTILIPDDPAASPRVAITYPVSDAALKDPRFAGNQLTSADGDAPCERMGISLVQIEEGKFALGQADLEIAAQTVVRGSIPDPGERAVPAFLILDRTACRAIDINTGTGSLSPPSTLQDNSQRPYGVVVEWNNDLAKPQPGFVHVDSDGSECNESVGNDRSIYANAAGGKSLFVEKVPGPGGKVGVVETVAPASLAAAGGINVSATPNATVISRQPVDDIYQEAIKAMHLEAISLIGLNPSSDPLGRPAATVGTFSGAWVELGCSGTANPGFTIPTTGQWKAYIACDNFDSSLVLPRAVEVIFSGDVTVANADRILLTDTTRLVVRRSLRVNGGGNFTNNVGATGVMHLPSVKEFYIGQNVTVDSSGALLVNAAPGGSVSAPAANPLGTCAGRYGLGQGTPPAVTAWPSTTRMVVFAEGGMTSPSFVVNTGGRAMLCQTSVYVAGSRTTGHSELSTTDTVSGCSDTSPCPLTTLNPQTGAQIALRGDVVQWYAPNQNTAPKTAPITLKNADGTLQRGGLEDVAVWGEGSGTSNPARDVSSISNNVKLTTSGIFFLPNSRVDIASGNLDAAPTDAQFIARRITMSAGLFTLRPTTANTVPVPFRGSLSLIR